MGENELKQELENIKEKEKEIKNKLKKNKKKNNYKSNTITRVSIRFNKEVQDIDKKREEFGFDLLSFPEKTNLIIKHGNWNQIKEDIIYFDKKIENNGGIVNEE